MPVTLPSDDDIAVPVIRTDFSDDAAWERLLQALQTPVALKDPSAPAEGEPDANNADHIDFFTAADVHVTPVSDRRYEGFQADDVLQLAQAGRDLDYDHLYLADTQALAEGPLPLLGIDIDPEGERATPFRIPVLNIAGVENNVDLGNMYFSEFHDHLWPEHDLIAAQPGTAVWNEYQSLNDEG
ncbi:DUF6924 domain-containing protein [Streptomyces naphthomycinicus]|uniref:DUF6924 domain-containing protein n=1 Tax=Streptomyces naphthomycinicus TaxID=2872625 RepID=UPI001CED8F25|nr:hypothetical protein [Streptomyces sp. TML10]